MQLKQMSSDEVLDIGPSGDRCLEIGCAEGDLCLYLSGLFNEVIGIDIDKEKIKSAQANGLMFENVDFYQGDINKLKIEGKFDWIICMNMLEYVDNPANTLNQIYRRLKPGGKLIIEVPNFVFLLRRIKMLFGKFPTTSGAHSMENWNDLMRHYFTKKEFKKLLTYSGFKIERFTCSGWFHKIRKVWISLLSWDIIAVCKKKERGT